MRSKQLEVHSDHLVLGLDESEFLTTRGKWYNSDTKAWPSFGAIGMARKQFRCPDCGSSEAYRSHPRGASEKYFLPLLLLLPVRCAVCYRRAYVSTFTRLTRGLVEHLTSRTAA